MANEPIGSASELLRALRQLAEKCACGDNDWPASGKAVDRLEGQIHHYLKCKSRLHLTLEVSKCRRKSRIAELDLNQKPRLTFAHHQKVYRKKVQTILR